MEVKIMKRLGLIAALGAALLVGPGAAQAAGGYHGGYGGGGYHGGYGAPVRVHGGYAPGYYGGPIHGYGYAAPRARVYVPGYWGYHSGVRVWIGGSWAFPPYAG